MVVGVVGLLKWLGTLTRERCITGLQNMYFWAITHCHRHSKAGVKEGELNLPGGSPTR